MSERLDDVGSSEAVASAIDDCALPDAKAYQELATSVTASSGLQRLFLDQRGRLLAFLKARGAGDEAEDLLQDMWQRLVAGSSPPIAEPVSYLFRIAENLMRDRYRERASRERRERDWVERNAPPFEPDSEQVLGARQRLRAVMAALAMIGPRAERTFRRFRLEGVSQTQIAREEGVSISTVEKDLQKAYRTLGQIRESFDAE